MTSLGLTRTPDGFIQPAHAKMRPMNTTQPGVFACGSALGPCFIDEAIIQGRAAAAYAVLHAGRRRRPRPAAEAISRVNERLCSGCALCVQACPFQARTIDEAAGVARVNEELCEGCGICASVCPNGAMQQRLFETESLLAMVDAAVD